MFILSPITFFLVSLVSLCVQADVYVPPVLVPNASTVWKAGATNTTNPPERITNTIGRIQLRKAGLTQPTALAQGFNILEGSQKIMIPKRTAPGSDYQIVLFGDSGNFSPMFTIKR